MPSCVNNYYILQNRKYIDLCKFILTIYLPQQKQGFFFSEHGIKMKSCFGQERVKGRSCNHCEMAQYIFEALHPKVKDVMNIELHKLLPTEINDPLPTELDLIFLSKLKLKLNTQNVSRIHSSSTKCGLDDINGEVDESESENHEHLNVWDAEINNATYVESCNYMMNYVVGWFHAAKNPKLKESILRNYKKFVQREGHSRNPCIRRVTKMPKVDRKNWLMH